MKVLAVIPARYGSSRFPGKPLIDLKGKTMIRRVYEGVSRSECIHKVIVATDDQRIFDEVKSFGGQVMMTSQHHTTGTDRCAEVAAGFLEMDVVINVQGDEPLVDYRQLEQLISAFIDPETKIATLGSEVVTSQDLQNTNRIKVVLDRFDNALYFSRSCIPNNQHANAELISAYPYLRHIGLYAYRSRILQELSRLPPTVLERTESLEQLRWLFNGYPIRVVKTEIETPNIDVLEDVENVLKALS
jgi:3-deoxy-manno-octulosonate cytidylyltransferase (CMP-KDO synthetase)